MTTLEFSAMVQKYQSLVYTVCHQLVPDVGDAQDLTQETFLAAWRAIDRCPPGFEKQWLARIAANKAKDYLRSAWVRRVNTPGDEVLALEGAPPGLEPEQQVLDTLGAEELTRMILDLREPYKTPCRLVLLEQHTMAEAARLCGRPEKTVNAQIYRAKKMLVQQIREHRGKPWSLEALYENIWQEKYLPSSSNTVMVHILRLRQKIEDNSAQPEIIRTIYGKGYQVD